jgi:hypothetical protein
MAGGRIFSRRLLRHFAEYTDGSLRIDSLNGSQFAQTRFLKVWQLDAADSPSNIPDGVAPLIAVLRGVGKFSDPHSVKHNQENPVCFFHDLSSPSAGSSLNDFIR